MSESNQIPTAAIISIKFVLKIRCFEKEKTEILEEMALSEREVLIEKILENLNLQHMFTMFTKVNKEAYESLLYLIINLTALEDVVVSKFI